jgi:tetratricopeptide (TPR) repeat protein
MINARSVFGVLLFAAMASGQGAPEKKLKPGEYDPYNQVVVDVNSNNFTKAIGDLDSWSQKFPDTDYKDDRTALYVQAYTAGNQPDKALEAAAGLISRELNAAFPGPTGSATIVRFLYNVVWSISHAPNPTPEAMAVGEKAARQLMAYDQPIAGVSAADWEKARASMKEQAAAALLHIAMLPGLEAMAKQPADCVAADAAYTRALGAYPDKSVISYELGRALNCESKTQPEKLSAAIYEFERAAAIDPTLGDPKSDPKKVASFADGAYVKIHGTDEGLEQLKQLVRQSPLPPEDFKIKTDTEIAEEKRAEFEKSNPQLALWMKIKGALADTSGEDYFTNQLKDSEVPQLRGVLVAVDRACRPREFMVAVPLPDAGQTPRPEIKLVLDKPLTGKPELNGEFHWEGVPTAFTKDPFLLTMDTETAKIEGLKTTPCAAAPPRKK